jgi:hypothetical protein
MFDKNKPFKSEYIWFADPGHSWLRVSLEDLLKVGVRLADISSYSYIKGGFFYLEEDDDAGLFFKAYRLKVGEDPRTKYRYTNGDSPIRKYSRFCGVVFAGKTLPLEWNGFPVVDGDVDDLRFLYPRGVIGMTQDKTWADCYRCARRLAKLTGWKEGEIFPLATWAEIIASEMGVEIPEVKE